MQNRVRKVWVNMSEYVVQGGRRLQGEVPLQGAKNAALPILAAAMLCGECTLHNCPVLSDITAALHILESLGCHTRQEGDSIWVESSALCSNEVPYHLMREMRSSIVFLGPLIARCGAAVLSYPGGCELGARPIDLHLSSLSQMGVDIQEEGGYIRCKVKERLHGAVITLPFPSVGATENILLAAVLAQGETILHNGAREPEIADLVGFLSACGAHIAWGEDATLRIQGVQQLHPAEYTVMPDRIVAATYLCCGAITGGDVTIKDAIPEHLMACLPLFEQMGCKLTVQKDRIRLQGPQRLLAPPVVRTMPYPGFPTDAQAPFMAACCVAQGTSIFVENIFENRYKHAGELLRMGGRIRLEGRVAVVEGVRRLHGAAVACTDLRGGAALVTAALAAEGESTVTGLRHIARGYENFDSILSGLGAIIQKV